jgi:hypothetical protein
MARGNPAMRAKRVTGPTPNSEMLQRLREQEVRIGGTFVYNPRTGKRTVLRDMDTGEGIFSDPSEIRVTVHQDHYH